MFLHIYPPMWVKGVLQKAPCGLYIGLDEYDSKAFVDDILIQGVDVGPAIGVTGVAGGEAHIGNFYIGVVSGVDGVMGGNGTVDAEIVKNYQSKNDIKVYVHNGFAKSTWADKTSWFVNCTSIRDVSNFVNENSGTSTDTGVEQTIPHGLVYAPNRVCFSNIEDGANPYQSSAADDTNIYVTAVVDQDYVWKAEIVC